MAVLIRYPGYRLWNRQHDMHFSGNSTEFLEESVI